MAALSRLEVPAAEAAALLRVQVETVQRRMRDGELRRRRVGGRDLVILDPGETWVRADDVAHMLGLTTPTVRTAIQRGELTGRRERSGRWFVRLDSVLEHPRVDAEVAAAFGGQRVEEPPPVDSASTDRAHRFRRDVYVQLDREETELLERGRERHGTIREAVVVGLRAIDEDGASPAEAAELRIDRDIHKAEAEVARNRAALLAELARRRLVDELYCPRCEQLVPVEEAGYMEEQDGSVALYHERHGYHSGQRIRASTIMARRRPLDDEQDDAA